MIQGKYNVIAEMSERKYIKYIKPLNTILTGK
jgi:hypothetical protein